MRKTHFLVLLVMFALLGCKESPQKTDQEKVDSASTEVVDSHTSEISLDWNGVYRGLLPCSDCPGILTTVTLNDDKTYRVYDLFLESGEYGSYDDEGTFSFSEDGENVILSSDNGTTIYAVGENKLIMQNSNGREISSELAESYKLTRLSDEELTFTDAPIEGYVTFGHEVSTFAPCGSSKVYWLNDLPDGKLNEMYEEKIGENSTPYTPLIAQLVVKISESKQEGFSEQYDGIVDVVEIKSVETITEENYLGTRN